MYEALDGVREGFGRREGKALRMGVVLQLSNPRSVGDQAQAVISPGTAHPKSANKNCSAFKLLGALFDGVENTLK